jgi:hypothetical protein
MTWGAFRESTCVYKLVCKHKVEPALVKLKLYSWKFGVKSPTGSFSMMDEADIISDINSRTRKYVTDVNGEEAAVLTYRVSGVYYLRTARDNSVSDNIERLPDCDGCGGAFLG